MFHACQLEYIKQCSMIYKITTGLFLLQLISYPIPLTKQTSSKVLPRIIYSQVHVGCYV